MSMDGSELNKANLETDYKSGIPLLDIADKYGVCQETIRHKMIAFGITPNRIKVSVCSKDDLTSCVKRNLTQVEAALELGVTRATIQYYCCKYDIKWRVKVKLTAEILQNDASNGLTQQEIASKYGYSRVTIAERFKTFSIVAPRTVKSERYRQKMRDRSNTMWSDIAFKAKFMSSLGKHLAKSNITKDLISKPHKKVMEILDSLNIEYIKEYPIGPYAFDIFIPLYNVLIEVQGDYWHSRKDSINRDKSKSTYVTEYFPQYKLRYVWEHECLIEGYILDKIKYMLGIINLELIEYKLSEINIDNPERKLADQFLYNWHYIHHGRHGTDFGGFLNGELICLARFVSPTRQEIATSIGLEANSVLELSRLCVHPNYHKHNLISKFLSMVTELLIKQLPNIKCLVSFADTSYGHFGGVYKASNWKLSGIVKPDYYYVDKDGWVMHKKTLWNHAKKMCISEFEYAEKYEFIKVWGHEKHKYIYHLQ